MTTNRGRPIKGDLDTCSALCPRIPLRSVLKESVLIGSHNRKVKLLYCFVGLKPVYEPLQPFGRSFDYRDFEAAGFRQVRMKMRDDRIAKLLTKSEKLLVLFNLLVK